MTDDQDFRSVARMPNVQALLAKQGTTFTRAYATTPTCCPSRATFLTGRYPHNHGVKTNTLPLGGYERAKAIGLENSTVATWLDGGGYVTALAGKYLNQYGSDLADPERLRIPPGWDAWWAYTRGMSNAPGYAVNEGGQERWVERSAVSDPDYLAMRGEAFVRNQGSRPFFLVLTPFTPHFPYFHAERHAELFPGLKAPRYPNFNEQDISDKPAYMQRRPLYDEARIEAMDEGYRDRMRGLMGVDEMVGRVVKALQDTGKLENTYIVFTSDNGYLMGEHRWEGKSNPYEGSAKIPLIVRGPGVVPGAKKGHLVSNVDWAPTIADLAGVKTQRSVDGRSLTPLLTGERVPNWRKRLLLAYYGDFLPYQAIRTADDRLYVQNESGEREFYDLKEDPYQLQNAHPTMDTETEQSLSAALANLKGCKGEACRTAEATP